MDEEWQARKEWGLHDCLCVVIAPHRTMQLHERNDLYARERTHRKGNLGTGISRRRLSPMRRSTKGEGGRHVCGARTKFIVSISRLELLCFMLSVDLP